MSGERKEVGGVCDAAGSVARVLLHHDAVKQGDSWRREKTKQRKNPSKVAVLHRGAVLLYNRLVTVAAGRLGFVLRAFP